MMSLTDEIDRAMGDLADDRFDARVIKSGRRLSEVQPTLARIKAGLLAELMASDALDVSAREIEDRLLVRFAEQGLLQYVYSGALARAGSPRHMRGLNEREAACLWLGMFRNQSSGLTGLWAAYLDLHEDHRATARIPDTITRVFCVKGDDGEDQSFIGNIRVPALYQDNLSAVIARVIIDHAVELGAAACTLERAITQVDVNLLRGGNTLKDAYAAGIAAVIDGVQLS